MYIWSGTSKQDPLALGIRKEKLASMKLAIISSINNSYSCYIDYH